MKSILTLAIFAIMAISAEAQIRTTDQVDDQRVIEIMLINKTKVRQEPRVKFSSRVNVRTSDGVDGQADLYGESLPGGKNTAYQISSETPQNLGLDFYIEADSQGKPSVVAQKILRNFDGTPISVQAIGDGTGTSGRGFFVQALWTKKSTSAFGLESMTGIHFMTPVRNRVRIELFNLFNEKTFYNTNPQVVRTIQDIPVGTSTLMIDQLFSGIISADDSGRNKVTNGYFRVTFDSPVSEFNGVRVDNGHSFKIPGFVTDDVLSQIGTITASANYTGKKLTVSASSTNSSATLTVTGTTKSGDVRNLGTINNGRLKAKIKGLTSIVVTGDDGSSSTVIYF